MERVIKFRVWDVQNKKFLARGENFIKGHAIFNLDLNFKLNFLTDNFDGELPPEYKFQQFTGLKDKEGKEIYEGDIVRCEDRRHKDYVIGCVKWDQWDYDMYCAWGWGCDNFGDDLNSGLNCCPKEVEIIGNIFENPELIK